MMYSNHFVMCVVRDGQPVKELGNGVVKLPFGAEYSLRFRNKNNRRAVVQIYIDGENVSGGGYVIPANDFIDIKRHHDVDRSFKFVSLDSAEAQDFGKDGPNHDKVKGTIEARFKLEKEPPVAPTVIHHHHDHYYPRPYPVYPKPWHDPYRWFGSDYKVTCDSSGGDCSAKCSDMNAGESMLRASNFAGGPSGQSANSTKMSMSRTKTCSDPVQDMLCDSAPLQDGCTVEGVSTGQNFSSVYIDLEETETILKLFLQGFKDAEVSVAAPTRPKSKRVSDLEDENENLRRQLAELENKQLKEKLDSKKPRKTKAKSAKKPPYVQG